MKKNTHTMNPFHMGLLALLVSFCALPIQNAEAQVVRDFSERYQTNDTGAVRMIGNTVVSCTSTFSPTNCTDARNGTLSTDLNNNEHFMSFVDVDTSTSTFNSSSATASLPANIEVLFAGLYWGGETGGFAGSGVVAPDDAIKDEVKLRTPSSSAYQDITANSCDETVTGSEFGVYYSCFADITSLVPSTGSGAYTVANIQTSQGYNSNGGWGIVFVYRDLNEPLRNLVVYDGFAAVTTASTSSSQVTIDVSGFTTPATGNVSTNIGIISYEGDMLATNARALLNSTYISDVVNPSNNIFNSTVSQFGQLATNANPSWRNKFGFDVDMFDLPGLLGNNVSNASITLETDGDFYYPAVVSFATELYAPDVYMTLEVIDLNGGEVEPTDVLEYRFFVENLGIDPADDVVISNVIPTGTTYQTGSMMVDASTQTDADDGDLGTLLTGPARVRFHLGNGANSTSGGSLLQNQSARATYRVVVNSDLMAGEQISNQGLVDFVGRTLNNPITRISDDANSTGGGATVVIIDSIPPDVDILAPGSGSVLAERRPEISGTAEPGSSVTLRLDNGQQVSVTVDNNGDWSYTPTSDLQDGNHSVVVIATDKAGNTAQDNTSFEVDLTAPSLSLDTPQDGAIINDLRPVISGTSDPNTDVDVYVDGVQVATVTTDANGDWSWQPSSNLAAGPHSVQAETSDNVGNTSTVTGSFSIDVTPPNIAISSPVNSSIITDRTPAIIGTAEANVTLTLRIDGGAPINFVVPNTGSWMHLPTNPLADGPHVVTAEVVDRAGNDADAATSFTVDTTPPGIAIGSPASGSNTMSQRPVISGTSEPGQTVEIFIDGQLVGTVMADGAGNWSYTPNSDLGDGAHSVTARVTDPVGNSADANTSFEIEPAIVATVDITEPANGDSLMTTKPTIRGTANPGSTVSISIDGKEPVTVTADENGNWEYTPGSPLANGSHSVTARVDDVEDTVSFNIDLAPPTLTISSPMQSEQTMNVRPEITGTADPGATVSVSIDGGDIVDVVADEQGNWSYTPEEDLSAGIHTVVVRTEGEGNQIAMDSVTFEVISDVVEMPDMGMGSEDMGGMDVDMGSEDMGMGSEDMGGDVVVITDEATYSMSGSGGCQQSPGDVPPAGPLAIFAMAFGLLRRRNRK